MNKQKKQFRILLIILAIVLVAFIGVEVYQKVQDNKTEKEAEEAVLFEISSDDVTALSYYVDGEEVSLKQEDGTWYDADDSSLSIDSDTVSTMLSYVESVSYDEIVADPEDDSTYGLDAPSNVVTITTSDATYVLTFGDQNGASSDYYMKMDGDDNLYTVDSTVGGAFSYAISDLLSTSSSDE